MGRKKAVAPPKATKKQIEFGELASALEEYCADTGRMLSEVVRAGTAAEIGRPELATGGLTRGRPWPKKDGGPMNTPNRFKFRAWWQGRMHEMATPRYNCAGDSSIRIPGEVVLIEISPDNRCLHDTGILMQSTGLADRNGVEIFEGDVLRSEYQGMPWVSIVEYHAGGFVPLALRSGLPAIDPEACEVIGNRYEHPELIVG